MEVVWFTMGLAGSLSTPTKLELTTPVSFCKIKFTINVLCNCNIIFKVKHSEGTMSIHYNGDVVHTSLAGVIPIF